MVNYLPQRHTSLRSDSGSLELFAAELLVGTIAMIAFLFFIVNSSATAFYKQKIGHVSMEAAQFAVNYPGNSVQAATGQFVKDMCIQLGLRVSNLQTSVQIDPNFDGQTAATVKVSCLLPLIDVGTAVPATINLAETSIATGTPNAAGKPGAGGPAPLTLIGNYNKAFGVNGALPSGTLIGNSNGYTGSIKFGTTTGNSNTQDTGIIIGNNITNSNGTIIGNNISDCNGTITGNNIHGVNGSFTGNGP